jgi:hypothetical protein
VKAKKTKSNLYTTTVTLFTKNIEKQQSGRKKKHEKEQLIKWD